MHTTSAPTPSPDRARPARGRAVVVLVTAALLVLGLVATAHARTTVERGQWAEGLFYGNGEFLLLAGGTAEDFCSTETEPVHEARYRYPAGGGFIMTVEPTVVRSLYLYETEQTIGDETVVIDDAPRFVELVCDGVLEPEPFAEGHGHMKLRFDVTSGLPHIVNSSWGTVTTVHDETWRVRGHADLMIGEDGFPTESPDVFQSLQLVRTGR